jgi:uncharacterized protein YlxW (UPF0749 family)
VSDVTGPADDDATRQAADTDPAGIPAGIPAVTGPATPAAAAASATSATSSETPETSPEPPTAPAAPAEPPAGRSPQDRWPGLLGLSRGRVLVAALLAALGFAVVIQTRQTQEDGLASLRQSDLVRIFDNLQQQSTRLDEEAGRLEREQQSLRSGTDRTAAAEQAARRRLEVLGILAGTLPATGPGIRLEVRDPDTRVSAAMLLDTVQELRDAGAEAIQVGDVRVVASTSFVDGPDGILVDQKDLTPPYRFVAIGDPATMRSALDIPGGVLETLRSGGADGVVDTADTLSVDALRQVSAPQYARPAPARSP